jgi:uncharacterized protein (TIGR02001 family)
MKKSLIALALVSAFAAPAFAQEAAPASPHTVTGNVALVSDYVFRGISQTAHEPAIQGGFDYSHSSGLYAGTWASNVNWVGTKENTSMEWDIYGGYRGKFSDDFSYDVGILKYYYTGNNIAGVTPDTLEVYFGLGWKFLSLKYSHVVSSYIFAWGDQDGGNDKNRGSGYLDLTATFDLGEGWGVSAHVGRQHIKNYSDASYTDWKLGVTKDVGFGVVGLAYTDTNADGSCSKGEAYCFSGKDAGRATGVLSFSKSF